MEEILEEVQVDINRACGKRPSERGGWLALGVAEGGEELDRFRV